MPLHADELAVDTEHAQRLLERQAPKWAGLPVTPLGATGSTNVLFRLGDELLLRLPRQPGGGAGIAKEQRWTAELGAALRVAVPEILFVGAPDAGFPEPWSVVRWIEGRHPVTGETADAADQATLADGLADVVGRLAELDVPETARRDPSLRAYRGGPLRAFDDEFARVVTVCERIPALELDLDQARRVWSASLALPGADRVDRRCWYHGDLVAENLLLADGELVAVLDFGGLAVGDPTIDLHGAWELFGPDDRSRFRDRLGVDDAQWGRARAWALGISLGALAYYWDSLPSRRSDRLVMARAAIAGD